MGKISTYTTTTPELNDKLIGSEANSTPSDATKNFTIGDIVALTPDNTLSEVLAAGNTATNDITLTGTIVASGNISSSLSIEGEDVISNTFLSANGEIPLKIINVDAYDDDAAAGLAGLTGGDVYQTTAANANGAGILMVKQ